METISVRYEESFIDDMESIMKANRYSTKAEFIREAIRDKMRDLERRAALKRLEHAYGAGTHTRRTITKKDINDAGKEAIKNISKKLK